MRILILCYEYPPLGGGGGRVAAQVAEALVRRGHEVRFITGGMPYLPKRSLINGIEVIRVRSGRKKEDSCTVLEMLLWVIAAFPMALKEALRWKPQVLHAHFAVPTGFVAWLVHLLTRIPYVLTAHLGDVPGGVPEQTEHLFKIVKPLTVPIWQAAARVTAVSSFVASLAKKAYRITPKIILNGTTLPASLPPKSSEISRLLMVGRLSVQKNQLLAIQALALLRDLPWRLKIIGDGPLAVELRHEVEVLGLNDRVIFSGWLAEKQVYAAMEAADLLLLPSLSEGLPMVGVEAIARGLAIVGSRIGGLLDIVTEEENGALFALKDEDRENNEAETASERMAQALHPYLENHEILHSAQEASRKKAEAFEWSRSVDAYESVLLSSKRDQSPSFL